MKNIKYESFPQQLWWLYSISLDGTQYINTNFRGNVEETERLTPEELLEVCHA